MKTKDENYFYLGQRIRAIRKEKNYTQEKLAEKADVGTTHISHIETGCTKLSIKTLIKIANALNSSADELLCDYINNSKNIYTNEITETLNDCTIQEIRFLSDLVKHTKHSLRENILKESVFDSH